MIEELYKCEPSQLKELHNLSDGMIYRDGDGLYCAAVLFVNHRSFQLDPRHTFIRLVQDENGKLLHIEKRVSVEPELWERLKEL